MSELRRHSTRNRGEPPAKLRKPSPETPKLEATSPATPISTGRRPGRPRKNEVRDTPTQPPRSSTRPKARDSPKLPTPAPELQEPMVEVLEDLSTLIERSRQRWLTEGGVFEKFWTKPPRKKKGQPASELPSRSQMNMVELGPARLIIEPHVFDVMVHGVKKPALTWQTPIEAPTSSSQNATPTSGTVVAPTPAKPVPQNPYVRPSAGAPTPAPTTPIQPANPRGMAPNPYAMPPAQSVAPTASASPAPAPVSSKAQPPTPSPGPASQASAPAPPAPNPPSTTPSQRPVTTAPQQPQQQQQAATPHPDPVIQMLAQRAAGDPVLKELMKVVAAGSESPEKLAEFQRHINEITEIVKQQQAKGLKPGFHNVPPYQQQPPAKQQYRPPAPIHSKPPAPVRIDFSHLAFDFIRQGDCFLFPKQSIIQHMPDRTTTLISFLFTRKGKEVSPSPGVRRLDADTEYYQPLTITLLTTDQKIREALSQVVGQKDQVSKEMSATMEKCTLAPDVVAMLESASAAAPATKRDADGVPKTPTSKTPTVPEPELELVEDDTLRAEWDGPDSMLPL